MCRDQGIGVVPYSPLARGLLAGTRTRDGAGHTPRARTDTSDRTADFDVAEAVQAVATEHGLPPARIALSWLFSKGDVTAPLIGATRKQHVDDAVGALALRLDREEISRLEAPYLPRLLSDYS